MTVLAQALSFQAAGACGSIPGPCPRPRLPPASRMLFSCCLAAAIPDLVHPKHTDPASVFRSSTLVAAPPTAPVSHQSIHLHTSSPPPIHNSKHAFLHLRRCCRRRHWRSGPSPDCRSHRPDLRRSDPGRHSLCCFMLAPLLTLTLTRLPAPRTRPLRPRLPLPCSRP